MDQKEIEILVGELESRVDRLRALYEQWFMGIERIEPTVPRKDVDRRFYVLRREQMRNTGLRFRFQNVLLKYNTYATYWMRIGRQIEEGTYKRDVRRAKARFGKKTPAELAAERRDGDASDGAAIELDLDVDVDLDAIEDAELETSESEISPEEALAIAREQVSQMRATLKKPAPPPAASSKSAVSREPDTERKIPVAQPSGARAESAPQAGGSGKRRSVVPPAAKSKRSTRPPAAAASSAGTAIPRAPALPSMGAPPKATTLVTASNRPGGPAAAPSKPVAAARRSSRPGMPKTAAGGAVAPSTKDAPPTHPQASRAPAAPAPKPAARPPVRAGDLSEERVRQIYTQYVETKRSMSESTAAITYDNLAKSLRDSSDKLKQKHGGKSVDFEVAVKDGKTILRPVVK